MIPEHPFAPAHSRESFLETLSGQEALRLLQGGLGAREPFLLLTGDPGTGKTALVSEAIAHWGSRITAAFLAYSALAGGELLEEIVRRFGHEPPDGASRPKLIACIEHVLAEIAGRGQVALIVVDDAHDLSVELLEELRLLVNAALLARRPLEVLLVGLPSLESRLADPALAALRQRVSVRASVTPLSVPETQRYLHHRVTTAGGDGPGLFSRRTCRDIATLTIGVPRKINALATEALRLALASGQATVTPEHVQAAVTALWGATPTGGSPSPDEAGPAVSPPMASTPPSPDADAPAPAVAPARARADNALPEPVDTLRPVTPAAHDAQEWVARFIGDRGPLQISSQAIAESQWAPESSESITDGSPRLCATSPGPPTDRAGVAQASPHPRRRGVLDAPAAFWLVAIVVLGAAALIIRAGGHARGGAGSAANATTTATASRNQAPSRPGARSRPAPDANAARRYTIDVGGYLELQHALVQRDRLEERTGIQAWVVPAVEDGGETHRIVLGIFRSPERATSAADALLGNGMVSEARVVPLPPRRARR